jgi:hypothetical protein
MAHSYKHASVLILIFALVMQPLMGMAEELYFHQTKEAA